MSTLFIPIAAGPLRVAVVGSGPAGFYTAEQLLGVDSLAVEVDIFDRLPTPWGLVRAGVAPDHPRIKSVSRVFEATAERPGFRFYGNVEVGTHLSHDELAGAYHAVVYATGAATDRRLGIPGESLPGSHAATEFVAWYNGHPDFADHTFDLSARRAVVVGNGNVALDVARMLALTPAELETTDVADHALEALSRSRVEEIVVLGRRGPVQAAYTNRELLELGELADGDVVVDPADVAIDEHSQAFLDSDGASRPTRRNVEIVTGYAERASSGKRRRVVLRFLGSPVEIVGSERVEAVRVVRNELGADLSARPTAAVETIEAQLVLRSIGYRGSPVPGVPFDDRRATIHNDGGRVTPVGTTTPLPGVYTAGWVKRGPSGVIGTNKKCAQATVDVLLEDLAAGRMPTPAADRGTIERLLAGRGVEVVSYAGWQAIDEYERSMGELQGRPRVKLTRRSELLRCAAEAARRSEPVETLTT
jgi:ferredoxin--NADP+ reductase